MTKAFAGIFLVLCSAALTAQPTWCFADNEVSTPAQPSADDASESAVTESVFVIGDDDVFTEIAVDTAVVEQGPSYPGPLPALSTMSDQRSPDGADVSEDAHQGVAADPLVATDPVVPSKPHKRRFIFRPTTVYGVPDHQVRTITGTRAAAANNVREAVYVLLPSQVALTTRAQPALYWYLSRPVDRQIILTLNSSQAIDPILEVSMDGSVLQGIQKLDLALRSITLEPNVRYEWVVTLSADAQSPAQRNYAKSVIWRIDEPQSIKDIAGTDDDYKYAVAYAKQGIWIDALAGISRLIDLDPTDLTLREDRASLLRQAGFMVDLSRTANGTYREEIHLPSGSN